MTARIVSCAQIGLSVLFLAGYFGVLILFVTGNIRTPPEWKEALIALLGVITGGIGTILSYWFARTRQADPQ